MYAWSEQAIIREIATHNLYCCLLSRCEALRTCRSRFPIASKWCCYQDVKVVLSSAFTQRMRDRCSSLQKRRGCCCNLSGGVVLIVRFITNGMCTKNKKIYAWCTQATIREIAMHDLYCCLLPRCEALRTCRSGFPIATKLMFYQSYVLCTFTRFLYWR